MILVDTSVWVDYLQRGNSGLAERLLGGLVCTHPYVVGELALENLKQRATVLEAVQLRLLNVLNAQREVLIQSLVTGKLDEIEALILH